MSSNEPRLGSILLGDEERDAIHIAIAPVVCAEDLRPGEHVGVKEGKAAKHLMHVGIVDPFLSRPPKKGEGVYIFLYPYTVTGMRHHWSHPVFAEKDNVDTTVTDERIAAAKQRLAEFAAEEVSMTYEDFMRSMEYWLVDKKEDVVCFPQDLNYGASEAEKRQVLDDFELVTGHRINNKEQVYFRCAC